MLDFAALPGVWSTENFLFDSLLFQKRQSLHLHLIKKELKLCVKHLGVLWACCVLSVSIKSITCA